MTRYSDGSAQSGIPLSGGEPFFIRPFKNVIPAPPEPQRVRPDPRSQAAQARARAPTDSSEQPNCRAVDLWRELLLLGLAELSFDLRDARAVHRAAARRAAAPCRSIALCRL